MDLVKSTMVIPERGAEKSIDQSELYIPWELLHQRYIIPSIAIF